MVDGLLLYQGRPFIPDESPLWLQLLREAHTAGHEGSQKTLHRLRASFYNRRAHRLVRDYVKGYDVCQRNKTEHLHPAGFISHFLFLNMCGATSPWTLLRAFRVWAASP